VFHNKISAAYLKLFSDFSVEVRQDIQFKQYHNLKNVKDVFFMWWRTVEKRFSTKLFQHNIFPIPSLSRLDASNDLHDHRVFSTGGI